MKSLLHLFLVLMTSTLIASPATKVDFIDGSLNLAIQKAGQEGKLLFVEFGAKWCMPCRFMEENTFKDGEVIQYIADNYVPVKIDIDDFDGYAYKQKYKVEALPTFLIFNSEGQVISRYEQSMAPSNLLKVLREHNQEANRQQVQTTLSSFEIEAQLYEKKKSRINVSPYAVSKIDSKEKEADDEAISTPITNSQSVSTAPLTSSSDNSQPQIEQPSETISAVEEVIYSDDQEQTEPSIKEQIAIETSGELLWEDESYEMEEETNQQYREEATYLSEKLLETVAPTVVFYTVRIGNFANTQSMNDYVKATSAVFVEDTHIFENQKDGISTFEVCLGAFASESSAKHFIGRLGLLNIEGEIKVVEQ